MEAVVVTGSSGALGTAVCELLAIRGFGVLGLDIKPPEPGAVQDEFFQVDLRSGPAVAATLKECSSRFRVLAAIGVAGGALADEGSGLAWRMPSAETFEKSIRTNLLSQYNLALSVLQPEPLPGLRSITFCGSTNAHAAWSKPAYSAAKAGLEGLMRVLAEMYGDSGVRVNVVAPGTIADSPVHVDNGLLAELTRQSVLGRCVTTSEVAEVLVDVATLFEGVTGQSLVADAGQSIRRRRPPPEDRMVKR